MTPEQAWEAQRDDIFNAVADLDLPSEGIEYAFLAGVKTHVDLDHCALQRRVDILEAVLRRFNATAREALATAPVWHDQVIPMNLLAMCDEASDTLRSSGAADQGERG